MGWLRRRARTSEKAPYKVWGISSNTNAFGLYEMYLVGTEGEVWTVNYHQQTEKYNQGDVVWAPIGTGGSPDWASLGFENPESKPPMRDDPKLEKILDSVWTPEEIAKLEKGKPSLFSRPSDMGVEDVPTVDPDDELTRLRDLMERGELTPEQFQEKARRLFASRQRAGWLRNASGMKLVYKETGEPVQIGDIVPDFRGDLVQVEFFREPHKPNSEGKVSVIELDENKQPIINSRTGEPSKGEYYVGVIGAKWIARSDRAELAQSPEDVPSLSKSDEEAERNRLLDLLNEAKPGSPEHEKLQEQLRAFGWLKKAQPFPMEQAPGREMAEAINVTVPLNQETVQQINEQERMMMRMSLPPEAYAKYEAAQDRELEALQGAMAAGYKWANMRGNPMGMTVLLSRDGEHYTEFFKVDMAGPEPGFTLINDLTQAPKDVTPKKLPLLEE
jgi:hypothetical protein